MQLYNLNLGTTLGFRRTGEAVREAPLADALTAAAASADGSEFLMAWEWDDAVAQDPDGPRAVRPLPPPAFRGALDPSPGPDGANLDAGSWIFCQARGGPDGPVPADVEEMVEWFAREAWWTGAETAGRLYLRLVKEDGRLAIQALRRLSARS